MENFLETLKTTAESAESQKENAYLERKKYEAKRDSEMILEITESLKTKLMQEAKNGNRQYTVLEASMHGDYSNRKVAFYDYGKCFANSLTMYDWETFYNLRNDEKTIQKIIAKSKGVFKAVYEYCQKEGLNPIVKFFDDGVGQTYGYGIYINW